MKKITKNIISLFMATIMIIGIIATGGISSNNYMIQAISSSIGALGTRSLNISGNVKHVEKKAESNSDKLKDIITKYDTGKPISDSIDIKDNLTKNNGTYIVSMKQFSKITGDSCSMRSSNDGILIQHGDFSVALNLKDNLMVVNNDEYSYITSPLTKKNNEYYFPVENVAEGLGYSVTENKSEMTLSRDYQSKRLLVKTEAEIKDTQNAVATAVVADDLYALQYTSETKAKDACEYFNSQKNIDFAEPDTIVTVQEENTENSMTKNAVNNAAENTSSSTYYSWGAEAMDVGDYTDYLKSNVGESNLKNVVIAVLDTGIDTDHPWFSGRIANNGVNFSSSVSSSSYAYEDVYGHGTHVSGIISNLTMDNVKILPIKVMNDQGYGYTSTIIEGIDYVTQQKQNGQNICAMNLSLGEAGAPSEDCSAYQEAIGDAYTAGVLTVVAAGNDGTDAGNTAPANTPSAITVAAVGQSGTNYFCPGWSNYGSCIDLSAPGYQIESAWVGGGTAVESGTSMAAPHVTAAIALLYSNSLKSYTLQGIEDTLNYFALDLGASGWDQSFGAGMVCLKNAYSDSMKPVEFSKTTSECSTAFNLTLSCPELQAQIYYTLDGSTPSNSNGTLYTRAIPISTSTRVKAVAYIFTNNIVTKCSKISYITYYFYGQDIPNSFTVSSVGELTAYTGVLTDVTVPSIVNGITVKSIGGYAFSSVSSSIVSVTLPSTVTAINDNAFNGCTALAQVYAPSVIKIGMYAFYGCTSFMYVQDLYFPDLLTIGKFAFYHCLNLRPITLSKVTLIDDYAFSMGPNAVVPYLTGVILPSVKTIGMQGFFNCEHLTDIEIPSAEIICANAFRSCNIKDLSLPSAKYLGNNAFYVNSNLISADMPEAVIIGNGCFYYYCALLSSINIPKVENIGELAFGFCSSLTELDIPSTVEVFDRAFDSCINLKIINAPKLKYVDDTAFGHCYSLEEVSLPSVVRISKDGFSVVNSDKSAANLKKVILSSCIEDISSSAFINVTDLCIFYLFGGTVAESFAISNGYTYVDMALNKNCFQYQKINNSEVYITGYTANLPANAEIPSYIDGLPVTKICANAFKNCSKVVKLSTSKLREIEPSAFSGCSNLKEICLLNIETIGEKAFYFCTGLNSVEITTAKTVGDNAFYGCSSLLSVELGQVINSIGSNSFGYSADELLIPNFAIYGFAGTVAEAYAESHDILFHPQYSSLSFFYYDFYQNNGHQEICISYVNKDVTGSITIPSSYNGYTISKIGDYAFQFCCFVTGVELPKTITSIGSYAFDECSAMETINCESINSLGTLAFSNCVSLKNISLPFVKDIEDSCFTECTSISHVNLPLVTSIGFSAFYNCNKLKTVTCPSLEVIFESAFSFNSSLQSIDLQNVRTIGCQCQRKWKT